MLRPAPNTADAALRAPGLVVAVASLLNLVSYLDRVCMSAAAPAVRKEFALTAVQLGWVFGIFSLSYALCQTPWGILADRFGGRRIVAFAISGWSAMTALTAAAHGWPSMLVIRFTFGALEAGLSPAVASMFNRTVSPRTRSSAFGIFLSAGRLGGAVAPPVAAALVLWKGWRVAFLAFALVGGLAALLWSVAVRPRPVPRRSSPVPFNWEALLTRRVFALIFAVFAYTVMWQFYATWFVTYLTDARSYQLQTAAAYASLPFLLGFSGNAAGGFLIDKTTGLFGTAIARTAIGFLALLSAAGLFFVGIYDPARGRAIWELAFAAGLGDVFLTAAWTSAIDVNQAWPGVAAGLMNSSSNLGALLSPVLIGWGIERSGNWAAVMLLPCFAALAAALVWPAVNGVAMNRCSPTGALKNH